MSHFGVLKEIGLSKTGVRCYVCLLEQGPATTRELAKRLKLPQTNIYGVLTKLTKQGFVSKFKMTSQPALFIAQPLNKALREHYIYHRRLVLSLCRKLGLPAPPMPPPVLNRRH